VLAVAVGLGAYLIDLGAGRHAPTSAASSASTSTSTTTSTSTSSTSTTTSTTTTTTVPSGAQPSKAVKVLVANASETNGIATYYAQKLASAGWGTLTPVTATTTVSSSSVYYASGEQPAARSVAAELGIPSSAVEALGSTVIVASTTGAGVVVVAGDDLAAEVPASSSG
jgi:hypothetical protein